jgi:multicomponent Na+:H+ antiporter subunit D
MGIVGALAISSFPLTSGFISKSMISQGAADQHLALVWFALAAASAGVFLHAGIKFPWYVFFQKDSGLRPAEPPLNMKLAMGLFAFFCIGFGVWPEPLYSLLPYPVDYVPYSLEHVVTMLELLLFSGLAFFLLLPLMQRTLTVSLDTDWLWRRAFMAVARDAVARAEAAHRDGWADVEDKIGRFLAGLYRHHGPHGALARSWPTGSMVLWAAALLAAFTLIYYFR